jgi:hypothetical protein
MRKTIFLMAIQFIVLITFLFSCGNVEKGENNGVVKFTRSQSDISNNDTLSKLINIHSILKLETKDSVLIGQVAKVEYFKEHYYILDNTGAKRLFVFDSHGTFINYIGRIGKGPGEFSMPNDFSIDLKNSLIYILSTTEKKVYVYNINGNFLRNFSLDFYATNLELVDNKFLVYAGLDRYLLYLTDIKGNLIKKYFETDIVNSELSPLSRRKNNVYFSTFLNDTIFIIKGETVTPFLFVDFGKEALTRKEYLSIEPTPSANGMLMRKLSKKYLMDLGRFDIVQEKSIFFFDTRQGGVINFANLKSRKIKSILAKNIFDDIFYKGFTYSTFNYQDSLFIGVVEPSRITKEKISVAGHEIIVNRIDNPYLAFYEIKENRD